jgi:hypothetical protein
MGITIRIHDSSGGGGGGVTSVNSDTGPAVVLNADDISDTGTTNKYATQAELNQIATNTNDISTNANDISTNANDISTNTSNISSNTTQINRLKGSSTRASVATLTPNISNNSLEQITAQAVNLTVSAPSGTPVLGQKLIINITDDGTARTISWNAVYNVINVTLPITTTVNKSLYIGCIYNADTSQWDVVAVKEEA